MIPGQDATDNKNRLGMCFTQADLGPSTLRLAEELDKR
jgi:hypothetical protein